MIKKNRNFAEFDKFEKFEKNVERFKNTLLKFGGVENQFFCHYLWSNVSKN